MRRSPALLVVLAAIAALAYLAAPRSRTGVDGGSPPGAHDAVVTRVVDGDTVHVSLGGHDETVRYIGMDTPESVKPGTPVQCYAKKASAENERLVEGRRVRLRFDAERRDRYGRLLAYVYRASDGLFVNEELVRLGYARTLTIAPNDRYAARIAALARVARERRRGLWGACL